MKQKIHIPCHSEQSEESHFQIPQLTHLLIFFFLLSFTTNAQQTQQPYEWQWAMNGGSYLGGIDKETIHDVKVGTDGNYYFIASIYGSGQTFNAQIDGIPVYPNNVPNSQGGGTKDIFLFSTDCEGNVRWGRAIGGGLSDLAYNLVLDSNDNVYIGGLFSSGVTTAAGTFPVRFSSTDSLPVNSNDPDYHKRIFLVKYDKNGDYRGKKALQGNVGSSNSAAMILDLAISNDTLHFIVGLLNGTHLDNQVTVPAQYLSDPATATYNYQYHLAKYNTDLDYVSSMVLPITLDNGSGIPTPVRFAYDENKHTYYMAGERGDAILMAYNGDYIVNRSYIIAINDNNGSKKWIREIYSDPGTSNSLAGNIITSLAIDDNSNVYIGGTRFRHPTYLDLKIYDPTDPSVTPYFITTGADYTVPMAVKFNSDGDVQWVQATALHDSTISASVLRRGKGITINGNEVALGAQGGADSWDTINIARPLGANFQPDPILIRFDKQSGNVIDIHDIEGEAVSAKRMTAVAADNDGNYIVGGSFDANLFMNNTLGITPLISTGEADFFVAKLANSACGSGNMGTEDFNKLSFNVYPNPTTGIVNVEATDTLLGYTIYDMSGKQIKQSLFAGNNQINLENASNGVYFIIITTVEGNSGTVKVVKR